MGDPYYGEDEDYGPDGDTRDVEAMMDEDGFGGPVAVTPDNDANEVARVRLRGADARPSERALLRALDAARAGEQRERERAEASRRAAIEEAIGVVGAMSDERWLANEAEQSYTLRAATLRLRALLDAPESGAGGDDTGRADR